MTTRPDYGEMISAIRMCLKCEQARQKKLLPKSPASEYTGNRISILQEIIDRYEKSLKEPF